MNTRIDDMDFTELKETDDAMLMAGFIRRIISRIKKRKRRKRRRRLRDIAITTPEGGITVSERGVSLLRPAPRGIVPTPAAEGLQAFMKSPLMLAIPAGLVLIMLMKKKRQPQIK